MCGQLGNNLVALPAEAMQYAIRYALAEFVEARVSGVPRERVPEVCGVFVRSSLTGRARGQLEEPIFFRPISNLVSGFGGFEMDMQEIRDILESGWEIVSVLHSHPMGADRPSRTDLLSFPSLYTGQGHIVVIGEVVLEGSASANGQGQIEAARRSVSGKLVGYCKESHVWDVGTFRQIEARAEAAARGRANREEIRPDIGYRRG